MTSDKYFYHCFPRPREGESRSKVVERGWATLQSIKRLGLVLAPEIVEWRTPVSIGSPSPIRLLQQRICFTELSRNELDKHSERFGPFAIEFDVMALRRAGALPVIYMPQALSKQDHLALLGPIIVGHLGHIKHTLDQLNNLSQFNNPDYIQNNFPGAHKMAEDCIFTLKNTDKTGGIVQEFQVPWSAIKDFLSYIGFENAPFDAMTGVVSIAQSLFYPTDDEHTDEQLGYYMQREWRITAGYFINGVPRARLLDKKEKRILMEIDNSFWMRELQEKNEPFRRLDKAVALSWPSPEELLQMVTRIIVPEEILSEARQIFGNIVTDSHCVE